MAASLLHQEVCRLRGAQEESCCRPSSRRLKFWNVSVQRTTALLLLERMRSLGMTSVASNMDASEAP